MSSNQKSKSSQVHAPVRILVTGLPYSGTSAVGWMLSRHLGCAYLHEPFSPKFDPQHIRYGAAGYWRDDDKILACQFLDLLCNNQKPSLLRTQFGYALSGLRTCSVLRPSGVKELLRLATKSSLSTIKILSLTRKLLIKDPFAMLLEEEFTKRDFVNICVVKTRQSQVYSFLKRKQVFEPEELSFLCRSAGINIKPSACYSLERGIALATSAGEIISKSFENIVSNEGHSFRFIKVQEPLLKSIDFEEIARPRWIDRAIEPSVSQKLRAHSGGGRCHLARAGFLQIYQSIQKDIESIISERSA